MVKETGHFHDEENWKAPKKTFKEEPYPGYFEGLTKELTARGELVRKDRNDKAIQRAKIEQVLSAGGPRPPKSHVEAAMATTSREQLSAKRKLALAEARDLGVWESPAIPDAATVSGVENEPTPGAWELNKDNGRAAFQYLFDFSSVNPALEAELLTKIETGQLTPDELNKLAPATDHESVSKLAISDYNLKLKYASENLVTGTMSAAEKGRWQREILLQDLKAETDLIVPTEQGIRGEFLRSLAAEGAPVNQETVTAFFDEQDQINQAEYDELVRVAKFYDSKVQFPDYTIAVGMSPNALEGVINKNFGVNELTDSNSNPWRKTSTSAGIPKPERILFELADRYQMLAVTGGVIADTRHQLLSEVVAAEMAETPVERPKPKFEPAPVDADGKQPEAA